MALVGHPPKEADVVRGDSPHAAGGVLGFVLDSEYDRSGLTGMLLT